MTQVDAIVIARQINSKKFDRTTKLEAISELITYSLPTQSYNYLSRNALFDIIKYLYKELKEPED